MNRRIFIFVGVFILAVTPGLAQQPEGTPDAAMPAATYSEIECSGFITPSSVPNDLYVLGGADNDFFEPFRQFAPGEVVFLRSHAREGFAVGAEYRIVRRARELFRSSRYPLQKWSMRSLGQVYEDVGRVKVVGNTPNGVLAQVTFACGPILARDIAIPYQPRGIPTYVPSAQFDRFAPSNGKQLGAISAAANNSGTVRQGSIVYVNLGETDGVHPGQRFRIFRISRDRLERWLLAYPETPRESVGELVILTTQEKSSAAVVVTSVREITLGDGVELE